MVKVYGGFRLDDWCWRFLKQQKDTNGVSYTKTIEKALRLFDDFQCGKVKLE